MTERSRDVQRLHGLLGVSRLVARGVRGAELHEMVAKTVAEAFGFGTAVVNLHRPTHGDYEVVVVYGSEAASAVLLGTTTTAAGWEPLLNPRFEIDDVYFLPAGAFDWSTHQESTFIPELEPLDEPDAWQPQDALLVPLRHSDGHLLGVLSLDEPADGLRPRREDLPVLAGVAAHLAQAVESADVGRQKDRLVEELRDAERRYRSLVERLPAIVYRARLAVRAPWLYISPQVETILGFSVREWVADPALWLEQMHPDDRDQAIAAEHHTKLTGAPLNSEYRMIAKDGRVVWIHDEAVVLEESVGPILQGVMYDVSERKQSEEALLRQADVLERTVTARTKELDAARIETLARLAFAAEFRDDETHHHTERVGRTAALLAAGAGLPEEEVEVVRLAAPLHDIGKLGVSDAILRKQGELSAAEERQMQAHTLIGAKILGGSRSRVLRVGEMIALTHHERWDGLGYPRGLAGEEIPISGRLTAIADVFDALTHTRPYKEIWPLADVIAEIGRLAGTHFDPWLVEIFMSLDHVELLAALPPELASRSE